MRQKIFSSLVAAAFLYISSPLILPVAMGAVLSVLFTPLLEKMERKRVSTGTAAAALTLGITVILIFPVSALIFFTAKLGVSQLQSWKASASSSQQGGDFIDSLISAPSTQKAFQWVSEWVPVAPQDMTDSLKELVSGLSSRATDFLGSILGHLPGITMNVAIVIVSVYFFLADGRSLVSFLRKNTIFDRAQTDKLIKITGDMARSVVLASFASGLAQMVLEMVGCVLTGTPNVAIIGLFVFVGSFIPVVGSAPITFSVALQQLFEGRKVAGIALLVTAVLGLLIDNAIRPLFLKGSANLHPLIAFVAAFGGLQMLGFTGVFLGPIIAALFVITIKFLIQDPHSKVET